MHRECAFVFPPRRLLPRVIAKARADGLRGVFVVPFAPSDPTWPTLAKASLTRVEGQRDPCIIVRASPTYVSDSPELLGAQRLAILAVDFTTAGSCNFDETRPACSRHAEARPRSTPQSEVDARDRWRIAAEWHRLGLNRGTKRPRVHRD